MAKRIVRLTESELIDLVRKTIFESKEGEMDPEPVLVGGKIFGYFLFPEGKAVPNMLNGKPLAKVDIEKLSQQIANYIRMSGTLDVIETQFNKTTGTPNLPPFITINVGTSHTGAPQVNDSLSQQREKFLESLVRKAFDKLGVSDEYIGSLVITNRNTRYEPSKISRMYDPSKLKPKSSERFGDIQVKQIAMRGLEDSELSSVGKGLKDASSMINTWVVDGVDEDKIRSEIMRLASPSDVKKLNDNIRSFSDWSSLESFLNDQLFDDPSVLTDITSHLDKIAQDFFGPKAVDTVRFDGKKISIGSSLL